ncbi:hypothetical protein BASA50_001440 [Batrachochytrium salamandrivorans]|uniref:Ig-like domain-containing protein n=1 Tax=Batrachochytrium salamandrivorans TaxID=1357716 RepID=A0ABQ8EV81_9FUNG|nr:hypothetical protein BASA50_001440 [Batrachochytrium salamandrivorans]KAH6594783.1 hypothetical protein BASA61_003963 [Batrachochytrium salamandrivorans]
MFRPASRAFRAAATCSGSSRFTAFGRSAAAGASSSYSTAGSSNPFSRLPSAPQPTSPLFNSSPSTATLTPALSTASTLSTMTCRGAFSFTLCWIDDDTS